MGFRGVRAVWSIGFRGAQILLFRAEGLRVSEF